MGKYTMRSLLVQCTPRLNIIFDDQKPRARNNKNIPMSLAICIV